MPLTDSQLSALKLAAARNADLQRRLREAESRFAWGESFTTKPETVDLMLSNPAPITEADCRNLISMLAEGERLKRLTNAELVTECLGSHAADYEVVVEMMDRLDPGWENRPELGEQRTDKDRARMKRKVLEEIEPRKAEAANPALGSGTFLADAVNKAAGAARAGGVQ